jgi:hypothetical protein
MSSNGQHNTIGVDEVEAVYMDDPSHSSSQMSSGSIGLYNEGPPLAFENISIMP